MISSRFFDDETMKLMKEDFLNNKPFPHLIIEDFLSEKEAKILQKALVSEEFELKDSDLFTFNQTQDLHFSNNEKIKSFVEFLESNDFSILIKEITGIKVEPGALDLFGSCYEDTHYLLCHDDQLEDRKIAYILYLSEDFEEKDGGALALLSDKKGEPDKIVKRYFPKFNSLIFFEVSKKSWHQVEEVMGKKKRYAIGGWLR